MRAATRSGTNISFNVAYSKPKCGDNKVLLKVKCAAINPVDYKAPWPIMGTVVGIDVAGVVEEVGNKVDTFKVGDEVYGAAGRNGSLAEFTATDPEGLALKPTSLTFTEAAALPVAYLTSYQALKNYGKIQEGDRVLVIGASGGTGTAGIQLSKVFGAKEIVGVCSERNVELVRGLGATEIIDYTKTTLTESLKVGDTIPEDKKFDLIYDCATNSGAGEDYYSVSKGLLKSTEDRHGQYVAINGSAGFWFRALSGIGCRPNEHLFGMKKNTKEFTELAGIMDGEGGNEPLKPMIQDELPFNEIALKEGFDKLKSRRVVGKIVFNMDL